MAVEADRVVVELVAQTQGFDTQIKRSGEAFTSTMSDVTKASKGVEAAANDVYTAHNKMGIATNNARIAQMELQHVVRGSVDSFASGASASTIFAQHIASVAEAASFMGGSLGAVGEFLAGPWGIAVTAAVAIGAVLLAQHKDEANTVEGLVEKLKKRHEQTLLQEQADRQWAGTLDGLIDRLNKLNEVTSKKLELPNLANQQSFGEAQKVVDELNRMIDAAEKNPNSNPADIDKLYKALAVAVTQLRLQTSVLGAQIGDVFSDLNKQADDWAQYQENKIRYLTGIHPELAPLTGQIEAAFDQMKKAVDDAAKAGVPFDAFTKRVDTLNDKLAQSPNSINAYVSGLKQIAAELEKIASIKPDEAIKKFQQAVIGAEGTGQNRMGSSAAGIGQFMPGTWLQYFNRLFPQFADMTDAAKLDQRNVPSTAKAVIESAANDYATALKKAGVTITETSLYAMHVLGQRDALKLLNAPGGQQTSDFLSGAVLRGNPFLRGTASDALSRIDQRIGDSSGTVSQAAESITSQQAAAEQRLHDIVVKNLGTEQEISIVKEGQAETGREIVGHVVTLEEFLRTGVLPSLKAWEKEYKTIVASQQELNRFGGQLIDDVLNPDNWSSWGDMGKRILHELEVELITLAAINPLKNLLNGGTLPTLGGVLGKLGGLFGGGTSSTSFTVGADTLGGFGTVGVAHLAGGGSFRVGGATGDVHALSVDGVTRAMVSGDETLAVIPSNARAATPTAAQVVQVLLGVEASEYFDARVLRTTGPVIAQSSVAAANGGASIGRRNLGREAHHRLEG
jgi:hypothetical protein